MTKPPDDLGIWTKKALMREVQRLRAVMREHAERIGDDPRVASSTGAVIDVAGSPHAVHGSLVDVRSAVLMETAEVALVHTGETIAAVLTLGGRINYSDDRVEHVYMTGPDGMAALVSELIGLASRSAGDDRTRSFALAFEADLGRRMGELP